MQPDAHFSFHLCLQPSQTHTYCKCDSWILNDIILGRTFTTYFLGQASHTNSYLSQSSCLLFTIQYELIGIYWIFCPSEWCGICPGRQSFKKRMSKLSGEKVCKDITEFSTWARKCTFMHWMTYQDAKNLKMRPTSWKKINYKASKAPNLYKKDYLYNKGFFSHFSGYPRRAKVRFFELGIFRLS